MNDDQRMECDCALGPEDTARLLADMARGCAREEADRRSVAARAFVEEMTARKGFAPRRS